MKQVANFNITIFPKNSFSNLKINKTYTFSQMIPSIQVIYCMALKLAHHWKKISSPLEKKNKLFHPQVNSANPIIKTYFLVLKPYTKQNQACFCHAICTYLLWGFLYSQLCKNIHIPGNTDVSPFGIYGLHIIPLTAPCWKVASFLAWWLC